MKLEAAEGEQQRGVQKRGLTSDTKNHKIQAISWRIFEEHRAEGVVTASIRLESLVSGQTDISTTTGYITVTFMLARGYILLTLNFPRPFQI